MGELGFLAMGVQQKLSELCESYSVSVHWFRGYTKSLPQFLFMFELKFMVFQI